MNFAMEDTQNSAPDALSTAKLGGPRRGPDAMSTTKRSDLLKTWDAALFTDMEIDYKQSLCNS
jgi:hypothetical protein